MSRGIEIDNYTECSLQEADAPIADYQFYDKSGIPMLATVVTIIPDPVTNNSISSSSNLENISDTATDTSYSLDG